MFVKPLVGIDGSEASYKGLEVAARMASESPATTLTLLCVIAPAPVFVDAAALTLVEFDRRAEDEARGILAEARRRLPPGVKAEERVGHGQPASVLVDEAQTGGHDLLIVGSHGRSGIRRFLLGSVASQVVAHAACPVLVVR